MPPRYIICDDCVGRRLVCHPVSAFIGYILPFNVYRSKEHARKKLFATGTRYILCRAHSHVTVEATDRHDNKLLQCHVFYLFFLGGMAINRARLLQKFNACNMIVQAHTTSCSSIYNDNIAHSIASRKLALCFVESDIITGLIML